MRQDTLNIRISVYWASDDVNKLTPVSVHADGRWRPLVRKIPIDLQLEKGGKLKDGLL